MAISRIAIGVRQKPDLPSKPALLLNLQASAIACQNPAI
jgi:hypothetical protein